MFTSKRKLMFVKNVPGATVERALEVLQDAPTMIHLNPLIIAAENTSTDDRTFWTITDSLSVLGMKTKAVYSTKFTNCENGMDSVAHAPAGTRLNNSWRVKSITGGVRVTEEVTVEGNSIFMAYTVGTLRKAHESLMDTLADKLVGKEPIPLSSPSPSPITPLFFAFMPVALTFAVRRMYPDFQHITAFATFVGVLSVILRSVLVGDGKGKEPYGLFHLALNRVPGTKEGEDPQTEWLNMGYWRDTKVFPEACEALALKLVEAARLKEGDHVLDVGHGTGESLIMLMSKPSIRRPASITGITSLEGHYQRSKNRVSKLQDKLKDAPKVSLYRGDAVYRAGAMGHPLFPDSKTPPFNTILALDCAYHFDTREDFLSQSFERLAPGGRIALADICLEHSPRAGFLAWMLGMKKANMLDPKAYVTQMKKLGYTEVELEDITKDVFHSFITFLKRRGSGWLIFGHAIEWLAGSGGKFVVVSGSKSLE